MDKNNTKTQIITISGGKGGIGKTFFSVNFAIELARLDYNVLIFDADINLSNAAVLLHINNKNNFSTFLNGEIPVDDVISKGVGGVDLLHTGEDLTDFLELTEEQYKVLLEGLNTLEDKYDYIIIDTAAGISNFNTKLMMHSDLIFLITNPELTALLDLYKLIKIVSHKKPGINFDLIVNRVESGINAIKIFEGISKTINQFEVKTTVNFMGYILEDRARVMESIQKRVPISILHEQGSINGCIKLIVKNLLRKGESRRKVSFFSNLLGKRKSD